MKLIYPMLGLDITFEENSVCSLVIENRALFYEMVSDIYRQIEGNNGKFVLSENYEPKEMRKAAELITGFVPFTLNKKDILTKAYVEIQKNSQSPEMVERTHGILAELERYICDVSGFCENEFVCTETTDITPLLKMFDLKFLDEDKSLCEKLLDYFEASERYKRVRLFVTVNLRSYIDDDDAQMFFKCVLMRKINLLCIENYAYEKLAGEKRTIIDSDLCII